MTKSTIKRKRRKSQTLGETRKSRQKKRCDRMFRHGESGRCIELDGRLARRLYPSKNKRMKAFKDNPCRGVLHWTNSRWRCVDLYARRHQRKQVTVTGKRQRKTSKYSTKPKSKYKNNLLALLSKL